jgi:transcriptional regulator with XRE-family HTH domain
MKSFGRLLRKMRGSTPLRELAQRAGLSYSYLSNLEAGRKIASEERARQILRRGFDLEEPDTTRLILGVQLYDLGLRDNDFRQLVIDLIIDSVPTRVREQLRKLYHRYADGRGAQ